MSGDIRVLHVDDEPDFAEMAATFLARQDDRIDVVTATSASAGLDILQEESVDCVVSDYDMPQMNGIEFLEAVRAEYPDLPFVLFTGKGSEEVASEAISAGVSDYLQKAHGTERYELLANRIVNLVSQYRAEQRVERTERRLVEVTETIEDVLWLATADWSEFLFVNSAYEELWGRSLETLLEDDPLDFLEAVHSDDRDDVIAAMNRVSAGESVDVEFRVDSDGASERWVWAQASPILEDGEVVRLAGFVRDITDRKHYEQAAVDLHSVAQEVWHAQSEQQIAQIVVDRTSDVLGLSINGVWLYDEQDDVLRPVATSEGSQEVIGEPPVFHPGEGIAWEVYESGEVAHYDDVSTVPERQNPETDLRSEILLPIGSHGVLAAGSTTAGAFDEVDVSLAKIIATHAETALDRAVRDRKLDQLRDRTQRLMYTDSKAETARVATDAADEIIGAPLSGVHLLDESGSTLRPIATVEGFSDVFEEAPQYPREHEPGTSAAVVWEVFETGEAVHIEDTREYDGLREETPTRSAIVQPLGRHGAFIVSSAEARAFDETDEALVEILATSLRTALDRVEREADLRERRDELQRRNERLDQFASVVSHDLRNPLNVAEGRLDLALEECESDHLAAVDRALDRMDRLIDDLLTLAREADGEAETESVELSGVVRRAWEHVDTDGGELRVETTATIRADSSRLQQLLENLFRNAVEHGGTRPVTVTVGDLDDADGFYVADDGRGIPPDERDEIFEGGYSTSDQGTGFGLNIVERIAEAHGWDVTVTESETGGSRFEFGNVDVVEPA